MKVDWYYADSSELESVTDKSGVYLITVLLKSGYYRVVYAGQADDIKTRLQQHFSTSETNEDLKKYLKNDFTFRVYWAEVGQQANRDGIESFLIDTYKPEFNIQSPAAKPIQCNLPSLK